ncbi:uncharacterized protein LOC117787476 [Drosophila innubila]|uniref:uncharacterized protein LOC117787476 n=1 Tax=Drosophila innubila TaxID=198719 RepID=UPI00148D02C8|nr:uncharacterized protein LOC117787476 [Drosophila innubila]
MFGIRQQLVVQLRLHYDVLAATGLLCIIFIAILDYGHSWYGCDLICWREQLELVEDKPMVVMLFVVGFKLMLILILTLLSYLKVRPTVEPPISHVKRRFSRFIVMRLVAALDEFLLGKRDFHERHAALIEAIHLFRSDARKLCERIPTELGLPIQQMLSVEEQEEKKLLKRGYRCMPQLRETDIYRLVLALPLP